MSYSRIDRAEGHHPLDAIGIVATPALPARIISLFQDELLAIEGSVLKTNPARVRRSDLYTLRDTRKKKRCTIKDVGIYSRATLHLQGANGLHTELHDVLAASREFATPALEMLLVIHGDLENNTSEVVENHSELEKCNMCLYDLNQH